MMAPPFRPTQNINIPTLHDPLLEGFLDDLISLDSPRSAGPVSLDNMSTATGGNSNNTNTNAGSGSVGGGAGSAEGGWGSPSSPGHWRLTNPVHMEVQENASLPTFHWNVDRSGSSTTTRRNSLAIPGYPIGGTGGAGVAAADDRTAAMEVDTTAMEIGTQQQQQQQQDSVNLAEMFLASPHRQSYHANYQQAGALRRDTATSIHTHRSISNSTGGTAAAGGGGDSHHHHQQQQQQQRRSNGASPCNYSSSYYDQRNQFQQQQQQQQPFSNGFKTSSAGGQQQQQQQPQTTPHEKSDSASNVDPLDLLAAEVDPTPLSEIRRKHTQRCRHQAFGYYVPPGYASSGRGHHQYSLPIPTTSMSATPEVSSPPLPAQNAEAPAPGTTSSVADAVGSPSPVQSSRTTPASPPPASPPAANAVQTAAGAGGGPVSFPSPLAHAVATAAAIASQTARGGASATRERVTHRQPTPLSLPPGPYTAAQQQQTKPQQQHFPRPSSAGPRLGGDGKLSRGSSGGNAANATSNVAEAGSAAAAAATTTTTTTTMVGAIERASQQKTQYGFGPKHVVPSVPLPPSKRGGSVGRRSASSSPLGPSSTRTSPITTGAGPHGVVNQGEAYERKKQRAKVARVKLNESIERLSIAIHLAGTQSKQRRTQWQSLPPPPAAQSSTATLSNREASIALLSECTQVAENAKKWDRPSFVGAAASLIQGLNAQCEHLMQELLGCHEILNLKNGRSSNTAPTPTEGAATENATAAAPARKRPGDESNGVRVNDNDVDAAVHAVKRLKVDSNECSNGDAHSSGGMIDLTAEDGDKREQEDDDDGDVVESKHPIFGVTKIVTRVSSFLDPSSLVRCFQVSKSWKKIYKKQESWQDMAVQRFGPYNVRQWKGKLEDEDEGIACKPLTLYRSMDAANVMPHFSHEGMFLLGESRLPGKVSAWTFLVERSNGETLRSVRRKDTSSTSGDTPTATGLFVSLPVIELRTVVQNTGSAHQPVVVREQLQTVDASTRRRGVEMCEIDWDDRFKKRVLSLDGVEQPMESSASPSAAAGSSLDVCGILCRLKLFDAVVLQTYIHAKGCSTTSKFVQRSNFTKVLVQIHSGTTVPLVIPFPRDISHHLEH